MPGLRPRRSTLLASQANTDAVRDHAITQILLSQRTVKSIVLSLNSEYFGIDWADGQDKERFTGMVRDWKHKGNLEMMVKWEGWDRCKASKLADMLGKDERGKEFELRLEAYENGTAAPTLQAAAAPRAGDPDRRGQAAAGAADSSDEDEVEPEADVAARVERHGQVWKAAEPQAVRVDARTAARTKPSLNCGQQELKTIDELFYHVLPGDWVKLQLDHTNPKLSGHDALNAKLTKGELLQWWGYTIALSLNSGTPVEKMWSQTAAPESLLPAPNMGQHGMVINRWEKIKRVLSFGPEDPAAMAADPWCFVRPLINAFNEHVPKAITAGWLLSVDELMSAWRGEVGVGSIKKCPFRSFVKRKPEPLGTELKSTADALSGTILHVEICEGKTRHKEQTWYDEYGHTTATTLRITEPWHGSDRVVFGDSWFAGVKCAEAMMNEGLHFMGDVKTNTRRFCHDALVDATSVESGAWAVYTSTLTLRGDKEVPIYSVSHRRGEKVHTFLSTCGTTLSGKAHLASLEDHDDDLAGNETVEHEIARKSPKVLNDVTLGQPATDRHNRFAPHVLTWRVLTWHVLT